MSEKLLTPSEVAKRLDVTLRTVQRWIADGVLPSYKLGKTRRVSEEQLERFLALHETVKDKGPTKDLFQQMLVEVIEQTAKDMEALAEKLDTETGEPREKMYKAGQKDALLNWAKNLRVRLEKAKEAAKEAGNK